MIRPSRGDILKQEAEALVNTVNCAGVMGRGIALQFRKAFEDNYEAYRKAAKRGEIRPGEMFVFERTSLEPPRWIINFPTKRHWKAKSRLEDIKSGLVDLVRVIREDGIRSIAIPPLGCGLGGLDWKDVRPLIEQALAAVPDVEVFLFEPDQAPDPAAMVNRTGKPRLTAAKASLLALMDHYLAGLMDIHITLLEIHKLLYFLQGSGEPLKLQYQAGPYGPYAENLRHVLISMEGHYISGYGAGEDNPRKPIEALPGAAEAARSLISARPETLGRFSKVAELIEGFESPYGMELLATVHWVASRQGATTPEGAIEKVHGWNTRKKMFTPHQVRAAWDQLDRLGWLSHAR